MSIKNRSSIKNDSVIKQKALHYIRRSYSVMVLKTKSLTERKSPPKRLKTEVIDKQLKTMGSKVLCI